MGGTSLPLENDMNYAWFAISAECDPSNSCPPSLLFAIRPHGTSAQEIEREFPIWSDHGIACALKHTFVKLTLL